MANIIVIALLAMIGIWLIRRFLGRKRDTSQPAYAGHSPSLNSGATGYTQEPARAALHGAAYRFVF